MHIYITKKAIQPNSLSWRQLALHWLGRGRALGGFGGFGCLGALRPTPAVRLTGHNDAEAGGWMVAVRTDEVPAPPRRTNSMKKGKKKRCQLPKRKENKIGRSAAIKLVVFFPSLNLRDTLTSSSPDFD
jgi:hypothetical protein